MTETTARFDLGLLETGQAQKEITHNSAMDRIDALLNLAVESRVVAAAPQNPVLGAAWIVPANASGAWAGHAGQIASAAAGQWIFVVPRAGCIAWVADENVFAVYRSGGWDADGWPVAALRIGSRRILGVDVAPVADPAGGTVIDLQARAAIQSILQGLRALGLVEV